jgi:hypothetical protein
MGILACRGAWMMPALEAGRRAILICCLCEKLPAPSVAIGVPLCLKCRTEIFERTTAAESKPITVLSNPTGLDLLIRKGQVLIASGSPGPPLEAA